MLTSGSTSKVATVYGCIQTNLLTSSLSYLGHEHEVDEVGGEGGVRGDEARVTPHELDDAHALWEAEGAV